VIRYSHVGVPAQAPLIHSSQHENVRIHVVINLDHALVVVQAVEASDVLLQGPLPRDRHRQEQRVQARVVEAFANVTARGKDDSLFGVGHVGQRLADRLALLATHAALQDENVAHNAG
jgi:hypothetical protein